LKTSRELVLLSALIVSSSIPILHLQGNHNRDLTTPYERLLRKRSLNSQVRIIYPVPHSEWVSPVQVVPKKGGMTVIRNKKNELIPQ
jgi:hypothetical protein